MHNMPVALSLIKCFCDVCKHNNYYWVTYTLYPIHTVYKYTSVVANQWVGLDDVTCLAAGSGVLTR